MAATLRPETMYGQTNCWVLPDGQYGAYAATEPVNIPNQPCTKNPDLITLQPKLFFQAMQLTMQIMSVTIGSFHCRIPCTSCRRGRRGTWASRTASRSRASSRRWPSSAAATCSACRSRCAPLAPRLLLCLAVSRVVLLAASQLKQAVLHFSVCQHRHAHLASGCGGMTLIEVALLLCVIDMSLPD